MCSAKRQVGPDEVFAETIKLIDEEYLHPLVDLYNTILIVVVKMKNLFCNKGLNVQIRNRFVKYAARRKEYRNTMNFLAKKTY